MNLKQLEYFVAIAEEGQITAAARRLHISQPPLSYELAQLERELGAELVRRGPRGVTLTEAGELLLLRARRILELSSACAREVSSIGKGMRGTAILAIDPSAAGLLPQTRLSQLTELWPEVNVEVREGATTNVVDEVLSGIADVGLVRTPFVSKGLMCRYAPAEPLVAVMPPALEAGGELEVSLGELESLPLAASADVADLLRAAGSEAKPCSRVADPRTACALAAAGAAVALVPQSILQVADTGAAFIKTVPAPALETRTAVIWASERAHSPLVDRLLGLL